MQSCLAFIVIIKGVITLQEGPTAHERADRVSPEMVSCALISVTLRRALWFRVLVWWEPLVWQMLPCHFDLKLVPIVEAGIRRCQWQLLTPCNFQLRGFHLKVKYEMRDPFFQGHCWSDLLWIISNYEWCIERYSDQLIKIKKKSIRYNWILTILMWS